MARKPQSAVSSSQLPFDQYAETQVVGIALNEPSVIREGGLAAEHFYDSRHGAAYRAILNATIANNPLDDNDINQQSGLSLSELQQLRQGAVGPDSYSLYAGKVIECAVRRKLIGASSITATDAANMNKPIEDLLNESLSRLTGLSPNGGVGVLEFVEMVIVTSEPPVHKATFALNGEQKSVVISTEELLNREIFKRKIVEVFHYCPAIPERGYWEKFVNKMLEGAKREYASGETSQESQIAFYIRDWFKVVSPAENPADLQRGYVEKDGFIYFQCERLRSYIQTKTKAMIPSRVLWMNIKQWGGHEKSVRVNSEPTSSRKMWGLPKDFFEHEYIEKPEDIDLSFLE